MKKWVLIVLFAVVVCVVSARPYATQINTPPQVEIVAPSASDRFEWNSLMPYQISVTDNEDGTSAYEEIATNEVFLKIRFVPDSAKLKIYRDAEKQTAEARELTLIKSSDCLNCHAFKSKVIGPSFESMAQQNANKPDAAMLLSKKVVNGSAQKTTTEVMPAHPDLANGEALQIVRWILKNAADPNVDYLRGLEGSFRTRPQPKTGGAKAVYLLTASYTDHGLPDNPATRKQGRVTMVLRNH